jgi:hypothetical protein
MADKDMPLDISGAVDRADEVGMVHGRYGDDIGIIDVEPPKPTPRWLLKLRALVRRGEHSGARPQ